MFSASLVQLGTTTNYITVEEKFLDFVLVYELACTELHELYIDTIVFSSLTAIRSAHAVIIYKYLNFYA